MTDSTNHPCNGNRGDAEGTWEEIAKLVDKRSPKDNGEIILDVGDRLVAAFIGVPYAFERIEDDQLRIRLNIWVPATGKTRWIEMSSQLFKDVCGVRDRYGLDKWLFEIERHDEDTFSVLPETRIDPEIQQRFEQAQLYDLQNVWR